jgi:hypothetical protein
MHPRPPEGSLIEVEEGKLVDSRNEMTTVEQVGVESLLSALHRGLEWLWGFI